MSDSSTVPTQRHDARRVGSTDKPILPSFKTKHRQGEERKEEKEK